MCGGFTCSKNALIALNILYVVVASILISVAVYGQASSIVTNLPIVGGILACGVFLALVSFLGLAGAVKHHQVMLFFYMVIMFLLFLVQFSVACACLAVNSHQQEMLAEQCPLKLTTSTGVEVPVQATEVLNRNLLRNQFFLETITHFAMERIPERVVHGRGSGAFGYFEVLHDVSDVIKSEVFNGIGKRTPIAVRFSPGAQLRGGYDTARESRGFAVKFYTKEGNYDLMMLNLPVFFFSNPVLFPNFVRALSPSPVSNVVDNNQKWDFSNLNPSIFNFLVRLKTDEGITDGYRYMSGYALHTFQVSNSKNETRFVRFTATPKLKKKFLSSKRAIELAGSDPAYFTRDLFNAIEEGNYPVWSLGFQVLTWEDVENASFDVFDVTRELPVDMYPVRPIGNLVLNKNPENNFADVEQLAFNPCNLVPGIQGSPDQIFETRCLMYKTTQDYRLGVNLNNIKVNQPLVPPNDYLRDGVAPVGTNQLNTPAYYPTGFRGPAPVDNYDPPLITLKKQPNSFTFEQTTRLYESLSDDEKDRFIDNLIDSFSQVFEGLQEGALQIFAEISPDILRRFFEKGWAKVDMKTREQVQTKFNCCSFSGRDVPANSSLAYPSCDAVDAICCGGPVGAGCGGCAPCGARLRDTIHHAFQLCGGLGLFFSFTEFVGVWLTVRYRNQKDPRGNPGAYL